jgi:glycosyltransferase involved in cell wall biosynthesis
VKIAMVDPAAFTLPYDTELCAALAREGHDVTLFTTRFAHGEMPAADGFKLVEWFYQRSIPGLPRRIARGVQHPFDMRRLARHVVDAGFDIVHVQWSVIDRVDVRTWKALPLPVVFTAHNSVGRANDGLDCAALREFDAVVAHSQFGADGLRAQCGLPNVWQVAMGAFEGFRDCADPAQLPVQLDDGPVVALTGLLRPYKGVDTLLEAWPAVRDHISNAQLVIAGRPMGVDLPDPAPTGVHLVPRFLDDEEYAWVLKRADLVCLPYTAIDLSAVLFSALAVGTPVVLSDVGGFGEFVGQGAELVPPSDPAALADTLVRLLQDPARRTELADEARVAAQERYSWSAIGAAYTSHYASLLDAGRS